MVTRLFEDGKVMTDEDKLDFNLKFSINVFNIGLMKVKNVFKTFEFVLKTKRNMLIIQYENFLFTIKSKY